MLFCLRDLVSCHFPREVAFFSNAELGFFQAQTTIRKWPGSVLLDGLGGISGSLAEVEGGLAFTCLKPDSSH